MPDVTPITKTVRYRRKPRTEDEMAAYILAHISRHSYAGGRCELQLRTCTGVATASHHVFPQRLGRDDSFNNLRATCANCNEAVERMGKQSAEAAGFYSPTPLGGES
jgi:5-methylcytosine-specific restriction endonuclease McrA